MKPKTKKIVKEEVSNIPSGVNIIDLSTEKRSELYKEAFTKFEKEAAGIYGIGIRAEIKFHQQGIIPFIGLVDLVKQNEQQNRQAVKA